MSIFAKMLIAPLLSLVLYTAFLAYTWFGYNDSAERLHAIRDQYLPATRLASDSVRLFQEIRAVYKDAVVAGEPEWIAEAARLRDQLATRIERMAQYPLVVDAERLAGLRASVTDYLENAESLAISIMDNGGRLGGDDALMRQVVISHNESLDGLERLETDIGSRFLADVQSTISQLNGLLLMGSLMTVGLLVVVAAVSLFISLQTRNSLRDVIGGMKSLASRKTDFGARLDSDEVGELGSLVRWFNHLSEKLEDDFKAMERTAITDKLTELNNRVRSDTYVAEMLEDESRRGTFVSIILFDLDHFKTVNDRYGHVVGDSVLVRLAEVLKAWAQPSEFIARWGGEEFIVVLPGVREVKATERAESLRREIERCAFPGAGDMTASFGVSEAAWGEDTVEVMMRVDACLYLAKQHGRNRVVAASSGPAAS